ncbi:hypothetical protein JW968_00070 [Candidatus Woesearchaeota archaeon]|nr:hypothetical protein [Candidatus Woesearchaeota archaeon]
MKYLGFELNWNRRFMENINSSYNVSRRSKAVLENKILQKPVEVTVDDPHMHGDKGTVQF